MTIDQYVLDAVWRNPVCRGAAVRAFFARACHRTPTDTQLDVLLATAGRRRP